MTSPTVDVHAHLLVPGAEALVPDEPELAAARAVEARAAGPASARVNREQIAALGPALTSLEHRLAWMDRAGLDVQLVSPMPIHHTWAGPDLAARYAAAVNDGVLAHCAAAPERLVGLGTTPLQHPDLAVEVLRSAIAAGLRGVEISTFVAGPDGTRRELDDPALAPFWAAASESEAVVFVHPWGCTLAERLDVGYLSNSVGNPVETTVALSRLVHGGVLEAAPGVRVLAAHGGGFFPYGTARQDHAWHARPGDRAAAAPPSAALRRIWFDALVYTPEALRYLVAVAGADRVALGTDHPFDMGVDDPLARLDAAGLPAADRDAIAGGTAAALGLLPTACDTTTRSSA
ncbi:amidohydrolase [Actinomycetospora endophytica]|uniref:Amidohydrolase n=1 Tax=Actinomycetospora endophytica TaxID=2291215 RepID=A0ABS8P0V1_9PSEU|nr:amidohydrolase family protein [Actinomycetospora endophytica]MCD2191888.1 amidohydrolase [Actinomycetospora endophytica]